ncbi:flavin reductase family protein [Georgenia sp. TF02-10]|uniref:flavin reductase family protein n=1 Tax=Georgenia sp. TF02-10 TaxID=2917725 RepID=UPI001FA7D454|nr:flavin reductase family protein [Georgenia sp. TF02-10]UNX53816.1 flavin reductase family protein [Georgenia sp. TF02-10]
MHEPVHRLPLPAPAAVELSASEFKQVFRRHPAGVAVVTLAGPDGPVGFTATSVISVSAAPPVLAFSVAAGSSALPALERADSVVVNFLGADAKETSTKFAARGVDRFAGVEWCPLTTGEPVLRDALSWVHGHIEERLGVGDSVLVTVRADRADTSREGWPLVYVDRTYHNIGEHTRLP